MINKIIIFGGCGYIGLKFCEEFVNSGFVKDIVLCDVVEACVELPGVRFIKCDVRKNIEHQIGFIKADWIFNFAAVHREPGHERLEYFKTNYPGCDNVLDYAELVECNNIFFTSSIAVYGPTTSAMTESSMTTPVTAYGISKLVCEWKHRVWLASSENRRLIICRPGVIYGPGDPGNILRMIKAVKNGYFFYPGSKDLVKSFGYVYGLVESAKYVINNVNSNFILYNYVENEELTIKNLVKITKQFLNKRTITLTLPIKLLEVIAFVVQVVSFGKSSIHPARVRKVATPTHVVPGYLKENGFIFNFDFKKSLQDWKVRKIDDFK